MAKTEGKEATFSTLAKKHISPNSLLRVQKMTIDGNTHIRLTKFIIKANGDEQLTNQGITIPYEEGALDAVIKALTRAKEKL